MTEQEKTVALAGVALVACAVVAFAAVRAILEATENVTPSSSAGAGAEK